MDIPPQPKLDKYERKHQEIPELAQYTKTLPDSYWVFWPKRLVQSMLPNKSWVDADAMETVAREVGYTDMVHLDRVTRRIREGSEIGCRGAGRLPTSVPNSPSVYEYGVRMADILVDMLKDGLVWGPLHPEEVPWKDITINQMSSRLKPNGRLRPIMNMSSPYKQPEDDPEAPASVNSGIDKEEFPCKMGTTQSFLASLGKAGWPAEMCKTDWQAAYKHFHIHEEDLKLQAFEFGGRIFGELNMVFGSVSSAGIYDDGSEVVLQLVIKKTRMDEDLVNKVLDDTVACGSLGDGTVKRFYESYKEIAAKVGVRLADETDKDKAFGPSTTGKVLGIVYDLEQWKCWIPEDKLVIILHLLVKVRDSKEVANSIMLTLNGKLSHYMWLVPGGAWQRGFLLQLQDAQQNPNVQFEVTDLARIQAGWWIPNLRAATDHFTIPDVRPMTTMVPVRSYTDAAGGDTGKIKNGIGGVCYPGKWFYLPWPPVVRENRVNSLGVRFAHKLSVLEGFAVLVGLSCIPDLVRNTEAELLTDNSGFVGAYLKKHSSCPYLYTVAKAVHDVAAGLNCKVVVKKTPRCSGQGEIAADALSKGAWDMAWREFPDKETDPAFIPRTLIMWIMNPVPDLELGQRVLEEMSNYTGVLL